MLELILPYRRIVNINNKVEMTMNQTLNKTIKTLILTLPLTFALTGCVVVVGDDEGRGWNNSNSSSEWKEVQRTNKAKIAQLEVGETISQVKTTFGSADFNEAFTDNDKQYQVLFYRTRHKHSDGETTKDECTPLIFVDGVLQSWGQKAYKKL
jgi:outer membrane protein assembly factor BamE (lipoprotein component of BamABCDE complex)